MTKPIICSCEVLCIIQVNRFFKKRYNFLALSGIKVLFAYITIYNATSDWPRIFTARLFLFSIRMSSYKRITKLL